MFQGHIPEEDLLELKKTHNRLFKWNTPDKKHDIVFTSINRKSYNEITGMIADAKARNAPTPVREIDEKIYFDCVVWPLLTEEELFSNVEVGWIANIASLIKQKSGFTDVDIFGVPIGPDRVSFTVKDHSYWDEYTEEELAALKDKYHFKLSRVRLDKFIFIFRPITRADLQVSQSAIDPLFSLVKCVCVWPENTNWDLVPAGYIEDLGHTAMKISGYESPEITEVVEL